MLNSTPAQNHTLEEASTNHCILPVPIPKPGNTSSPVIQSIQTTSISTQVQSDGSSDPLSLTIVFGVLGVVVAVIGLGIAGLQLRHMYQRRKALHTKPDLA